MGQNGMGWDGTEEGGLPWEGHGCGGEGEGGVRGRGRGEEEG